MDTEEQKMSNAIRDEYYKTLQSNKNLEIIPLILYCIMVGLVIVGFYYTATVYYFIIKYLGWYSVASSFAFVAVIADIYLFAWAGMQLVEHYYEFTEVQRGGKHEINS